MHTVKIANLKCGGCAKTIEKELGSRGASDIVVDLKNQTISFEGDRNSICQELSRLGYPEQSSPEAKQVLKKVRSYFSCMMGKTKK